MGGNSQGEIDDSRQEPGSVADFVALVSETVGRHFKCCICLSTFNDPVMLPCNHAMCRPCALQALKQKQRCPECLNSIPNLRTAQRRNAWIADMVDSLRNCLNEVGASLTQHAPVPPMYRNATPLSPRGLARVRARERASASDRPVPPSPPEPPCCGATAPGSENSSRNGRSDGLERRRLPGSLQPERRPAHVAPSQGRGRPRRETYRGRSQSRPPPLRGRRVDSSAPLDTQLPHSDAPLGREPLHQELPVNVVDPVEREVQASPPSVEPFVVGDLVFVANRTWPGINKYGGVALIKAVLDPPGSRYDVKYMVTQKHERGVEACFIQPHAFVSDPIGARPRRGSKRTSGGRVGEDEDRSSAHSRLRRAATPCSPATTITTRTPLRPSAPGSGRGNGVGELVTSGEAMGGRIGQHTNAVVAECRLSAEHPVEGLGCSSALEAGTPSSGERVQAADVPRPEGSHTVSDNGATAPNPDGYPVDPGTAQEGMQCQTPVVTLEQHAAAKTETRSVVPREKEASAGESRDLRIPEQSSLDVEEALGPCAAAAAEIGRCRRRDEQNPIVSSVETPTKRARAETSTMPLLSRQDPQPPTPGVPPVGHELINPSPIERLGTPRAQSVVIAGHRSTTDSSFVSPERRGRGATIACSKRTSGTGVAVVATPKKVGANLVRRESDASVVGAGFQQPGILPPGSRPPQPLQSAARVASSSPEQVEVSRVLPAPSPREVRPPATPSQVPQTTPSFKVGDVVTVQSQSSPGVNKEGGVARVVRTGPNETYDVKYLVRQGTDKGVRLELLSRYDVDGGGSGGAPACSGSGDSNGESGTGPLDVARTAATPGSSAGGGAGGRPAKRLQRSTKGNCAPDLAAGQANAVYLNILLGDTQHPDHDLDSDLGEALDPTEGSPSVRGARKAVAAREESGVAAVTGKASLREDYASVGGKRKADNRSARRKQDPGKDDALMKAKRAKNADAHDVTGGGDGGGCDVSVDAHDTSCEDETREGRNPCDGRAAGARMERSSRSPRIASPLVAQAADVSPKTETASGGNRKPLQQPPPIAKRRGQTRSVILSTSGLTPQMTALAGDLAKSHGWKIESKYTEDVTHVVCRTATGSNRAHIRSAKFLRAVAAGKWVLNEAWLQECKRRGSPAQEEAFEITGDKKSNVPAAPRRSRIAHGEPDRLGLFHDTVFYFRGEFGTESPPRSELEPMLMANGGIVVETLRALLSSRSDGTGSGSRDRRRRRVVLFQASPSAPERDARALAKELSSVGRPSPAPGGSGASRGRGREIGVAEVEILRPLWLVDSIGSFRVLAPSVVHRVSLPEVEIPA